jgi:DNA-binding NarL/FixJ family response regulator
MTIVIADDDKLVLSSLNIILSADPEVTVLASGNNSDEAVRLYERHKPDLILLDIRMGEKTGIDAAKRILEKDTDAKVLFLTTFEDDAYILESLRIGAKGYILKQDYESIVPALKAVYSGQTVFGQQITAKLPRILHAATEEKGTDTELSERELDIIRQVGLGLSNKEIAQKLYLSEGTVRNYISVVLEKLNLRDRTQLAIYYHTRLK